MVAHLLAARGVLTDDRPPGHLEVGAAEVLVPGDEEDLLLEADVGDDLLDVVAEEGKEALSLGVESLVGTKEGGLLVEGGPVVGHKGGGDEDGVAAEENIGGGVNSEVTSGSVRGAEATVGEGGSVGLGGRFGGGGGWGEVLV